MRTGDCLCELWSHLVEIVVEEKWNWVNILDALSGGRKAWIKVVGRKNEIAIFTSPDLKGLSSACRFAALPFPFFSLPNRE